MKILIMKKILVGEDSDGEILSEKIHTEKNSGAEEN